MENSGKTRDFPNKKQLFVRGSSHLQNDMMKGNNNFSQNFCWGGKISGSDLPLKISSKTDIFCASSYLQIGWDYIKSIGTVSRWGEQYHDDDLSKYWFDSSWIPG